MAGDRSSTSSDLGARVRAKLSSLGNSEAMDAGVLDRLIARVRLPLDRRHLRVTGRIGQVARLVRAGSDEPTEIGPARRVLVLALRGWTGHNAVEAAMARALQLRGADVALLTCGGGQPICEQGWGRRVFPRPCDRCGWYTDRLLEATGMTGYRLADRFAWGADSSAAPTEPPACPDAAAAISAPWVLKSADSDLAPDGPAVVDDFGIAAEAVRRAAGGVLDSFRPDVVFMLNGLFAAEHSVRELALARGLRAPTYEMAPRGGALCFSQDSPAPEHDTNAAWARFGDQPLTTEQEEALERLLIRRATGEGAHERYYEHQEDDAAVLRERLQIPDGKRVLSLFTNLSWDSATLFHDLAYGSMFDWVEHAVRTAATAEDAVLVVRVHPAERRWRSREEIETVLRGRLGGDLPSNVRLIRPEEALSSYALLELSELALTYTTTVGIEAAVRGLPVAVAGRTHYRGRGFTIDVESQEDLERAIRVPGPTLDSERVALARRYAFAYFFRTMIPFAPVRLAGGRPEHVSESADELLPGRDPLLDWVCDRILDGGEFALPDALAT